MTTALTIQGAKGLLETRKDQLEDILPKNITPAQFITTAVSCIDRNPDLLNCTKKSLLMAFMEAANLGLMPTGALGEGYILPYANKGKKEAQFQPGYRGLVTLCRRSGSVVNIVPRTIYSGDKYKIEYGDQPRLTHEPALANRGDMIAFYAVATMKDGSSQFLVMTKDEVDRIRKMSRSGGSGPWQSHYEAMAWKTVIRQLVKYLPMDAHTIARAIEVADEDTDLSKAKSEVDDLNAALGGDGSNEPEEAEWQMAEEPAPPKKSSKAPRPEPQPAEPDEDDLPY